MEPLLLGFAMIVVWWIAWFGSRYWSIRKRGEAIEDDREDYQRSRIEDLEIMLDNMRQELYFKRDDLEQAQEEKIGLKDIYDLLEQMFNPY